MMSAAMRNDDPALVTKCLDFCQALTNMGLTFNISSFSFSLDTRGTTFHEAVTRKKRVSPSRLRRNQRRKEEFLKKKTDLSSDKESEAFKCEECGNSYKSENGLKIHAGKSHKKVTSLSSTPERLRQQLEGSVSLSVSPLLDASREEFNLKNDAVEEKENPPPSLRPLPSPPSPHKCPPFHPWALS